jgi:hypothetical protein
MAWSTPPTFVDDATVTAAQLNTLKGDIEFLASVTSQVNAPFGSWALNSDDANEDHNTWYIIHTARYLHFKIELLGGDIQDIAIRYNDLNVWEDATNRTWPYTYEGYVDLNDTGVITPTPDYGEEYSIWVTTDGNPSCEVRVDYIIEYSETTL